MIKISELVGKDVFSDKGKRLGKVYDVIIDLQQGEAVRLTLAPFTAKNKDDVAKQFKDKTIIFRNISSIADSVIVSSKPMQPAILVEVPEGQSAPQPVTNFRKHVYSYRYKS